ncbi:MAG: right-handed parallel beta-helix repeat-containing protein [Planctomycetales bacterium]|nr:right-handed parallel beta-helix repeat-containing protein [Planctomycetales bacterium]
MTCLRFAFFFAWGLCFLGKSSLHAESSTWLEVGGIVYGAQPDQRGPLGGGEGYADVVTSGDFHVQDVDTLLDALSKAQAGQVIFIPGDTEIDLTTHVYIDQLALKIPEGVTLASDRGHQGSPGALLCSDALKTPAIIRTAGPRVRVTGLRIRGPNPKRYMEHHRRSFGPGGEGHKHYYKFPLSEGVVAAHPGLQVDNCELSAFSMAAISLDQGQDHHIHHNFIHHCQYNGLGYGVCLSNASALIEFNLFDWNRHSIAGTGQPGCGYVARHNVELGESLSHCFDMHGGRDRKDNTDIAGTSIEIYNNTFRGPKTPVVIRGTPQDKCEVHHNWFLQHAAAAKAVGGLSKQTRAFENVYGPQPTAAN